ncbi:NAD(+) kinase [Haliea sp. AH-315-K21]|uniref:NAD kinase n=1 Tax=SAR86 cluster bacterium TaxID=2030880 RepID=A0A2A5C847_9GAMM|nr:NAD(+) kinase [Haliea sp. AH-315-K21]PCJ39982.1 MAG: NAD(+) kinase [SAR86 cluster bacterium]
MSEFSSIGLIGRQDNANIADSLNALADFLLQREGIKLVVDEAVSNFMQAHSAFPDMLVVPQDELYLHCDLVIVVGGDGSMLKVAGALANQNIPVVGINRGRLGFLTDIRPEELENSLGQVLDGKYKEESRFLLNVSMARGDRKEEIGCALNDVVLHPGIAAQMIEFSLYIDDEFVYQQASDGLIVATPTGSTAYSMSAGGPIMHPKLDAVVLVPMYPHSLSSRPVVIDGKSEIKITVGDRHQMMPQVSCDGSVEFTAEPGDQILVSKKAETLRLLHPVDYNYYATCRSKLGWSQRLGSP